MTKRQMAEEKLGELFSTQENPPSCFMCNKYNSNFYFVNGICSTEGLAFCIGCAKLQAA